MLGIPPTANGAGERVRAWPAGTGLLQHLDLGSGFLAAEALGK